MSLTRVYNSIVVALLLGGGAISLYSCSGNKSQYKEASYETLLTESSDSLEIIVSKNGRTSYRFIAPLVEGYGMAREPYREFREGVEIITYKNDSLTVEDVKLTARYAIYYINRDLWETRGDVNVNNSDGKELFSQQLFWDAKREMIYSNVDTKIVDHLTGDTYIGEGFESDEKMEYWSYRKMKGRMEMNLAPTRSDSLSTEEPLVNNSDIDVD